MTALDLQAAISSYHDLCTPDRVASTWEQLESGMDSRHLRYGQRWLCLALRPQFLALQTWRHAGQASAMLASAFDRVYAVLCRNPDLRAHLCLTPEEEAMVSLPTGYGMPVPMGRLDSFLRQVGSGQGPPSLRFVEYNAESPAAIAYQDELAELFLDTPLMRQFCQHYHVRPLWGRPAALQVMLQGFRQWGGRQLPRIAIVDWEGVPTAGEFLLFRDYFARHGIECVVVDPSQLEYAGGVLYASGRPVDFVYKRVLTHELLQRHGLDHPLIDAVRDSAVCMMNSFAGAVLLHKKAAMALLSDERNTNLFSSSQQAAIARHVPWTRRVEERITLFQGREVDLVPFVLDQRQQMVLKPNDGYGGQGIVMGWETTDHDWQQAVQAALHAPTIVQQQAPMSFEQFPCRQPDGTVVFEQRLVDCDPFLFGGSYVGGCLTRLSASALLNVTSGAGSLVPTFVLAGAKD